MIDIKEASEKIKGFKGEIPEYGGRSEKDITANKLADALRNCAYENSCNGCPFALTGDNDCKEDMMIFAADMIERLNDFDKTQSAILLEKNAKLETELAAYEDIGLAPDEIKNSLRMQGLVWLQRIKK